MWQLNGLSVPIFAIYRDLWQLKGNCHRKNSKEMGVNMALFTIIDTVVTNPLNLNG